MYYKNIFLSIITFIYLYPFIKKKSKNLLKDFEEKRNYFFLISMMAFCAFFIGLKDLKEYYIYIFLAYSSLTDLKYMIVENSLVVFFIFLRIFLGFYPINLFDLIFALIFFFILLVFSIFLSIGMGDIKAIFILFIYLGFLDGLNIVFYSLSIFSFYGLISLIFKKNKLNTKVSFIPFIYIAYLVKILFFDIFKYV